MHPGYHELKGRCTCANVQTLGRSTAEAVLPNEAITAPGDTDSLPDSSDWKLVANLNTTQNEIAN